jgi:hypothetical protein
VIGLLSSTYNTVRHIVAGAADAPAPAGVTGFTLGYITRSISEVELAPFSGDLSGARLSSIILSADQTMTIWIEKLAGKSDRVDDYRRLSEQWRLISPNQWFHSVVLRSYVVAVEAAIQGCAYGKPPFDALLFDALMSLFAFSFMKLSFEPVFISVLEIVVSVIVNRPHESGFETNGGAVLNFEETASLVFWVFKAFLQNFVVPSDRCKVPVKSDLFLPTKSILSSVSPATAAMLDEKGWASLDFCERDIAALFVRERPLAASQLFLTALIVSDDAPRFVECTLCSVLVLLHDRLEAVGDEAGFAQLFEKLLPTVDIRLILYNVENLLAVLHRTDDH